MTLKEELEILRGESIEVFDGDPMDIPCIETSDAERLCKHPVVSVHMITYNHEPYIRQAIEGVMMQKTDFEFELVIGEDCSQDKTREICFEYQKKYPDRIRVLWWHENVSKLGGNGRRNRAHCRGEFIAFCEGDDYWNDPYKIITQVNLFESHPDVHFIVHKTGNYDIKGNRLGFIPRSKMESGIYRREDVVPSLIETYLFHTTSYMFKTEEYKKYCENLPLFAKEMSVGDYALQLYFSNLGNIIFLNKEMSAHVHNVPGSWTDKSHKNDYDVSIKHQEEMNHCMKLFDTYISSEFHRNLENRINKFEMHKLYHDNKFSEIVRNKNYSKALKKYDYRSYLSICLRVRFPFLFRFFKK